MKLRKAMEKSITTIVNRDNFDYRIVKLVDGKYRLYADFRRTTDVDPYIILELSGCESILDTKGWN